MTFGTAGIIGLGSIGRRHARLLRALDPDVRLFAYRTSQGALREPAFHVTEVTQHDFFASKFDLVVIANPSSMHLQTLRDVLGADLARTVVVEKPFCLPKEAADAGELITTAAPTRVLPGNSLRFHPAITLLVAAMQNEDLGRAVECHAHFGTFMPGWHPYEDYRGTYAARKELGGGVLLTSIHEIDLVHHLFGDGTVTGAYVGRIQLDEIDVEDTAHLLLKLERCGVANVSLNFFERPADRFLKVVFERGVWSWTFGQPSVRLARWNGERVVETRYDVDDAVDAMYLSMWARVLGGDPDGFEMDSVFASLKTIETAKAMTEGSGWN